MKSRSLGLGPGAHSGKTHVARNRHLTHVLEALHYFLLGCALVGSGGEILCCASAPCNLYVEVSAREPRSVIEQVSYLQRGTTIIITAYSKAVSTRKLMFMVIVSVAKFHAFIIV